MFLLPLVFGAWGLGTGVSILWRRYGWRESIAAHYSVLMRRAEVQVAPLATNFHYELNSDVGSAAPLALPEPIAVVKPMAEWLAWIDEQPHTLLGLVDLAPAPTVEQVRAEDFKAPDPKARCQFVGCL